MGSSDTFETDRRCADLAQRLGRRLRIGLLEDEPHTREAIARRLRAIDAIDLTCCEATLSAMRERLRDHPIDVLITDLGLPDGSGLELIAEVHRRSPAAHILVLTVLDDESRVVSAIAHGARGYLLKDESSLGLVDAIVEIVDGGAPISPAIARYLVRRMAHEHEPSPGSDPIHLTERERQVLELAAKGFTQAEIADLLGVSTTTVVSYVRRIYVKLQVGSRSAAIYEATRRGLIDVR